jgi:hypothetical protein
MQRTRDMSRAGLASSASTDMLLHYLRLHNHQGLATGALELKRCTLWRDGILYIPDIHTGNILRNCIDNSLPANRSSGLHSRHRGKWGWGRHQLPPPTIVCFAGKSAASFMLRSSSRCISQHSLARTHMTPLPRRHPYHHTLVRCPQSTLQCAATPLSCIPDASRLHPSWGTPSETLDDVGYRPSTRVGPPWWAAASETTS